MRIRNPGWKKFESGIPYIHPGSATLDCTRVFEQISGGGFGANLRGRENLFGLAIWRQCLPISFTGSMLPPTLKNQPTGINQQKVSVPVQCGYSPYGSTGTVSLVQKCTGILSANPVYTHTVLYFVSFSTVLHAFKNTIRLLFGSLL